MAYALPRITVVEASPLISFLKVDRFDIVEALGGEFVCTSHGLAEVGYFQQRASLDALLTGNRIREVDLDEPAWLAEFARLVDETPLGAGEVSSLLYAERHAGTLIITDRKGIREAKRRGVACLTTQELMLWAIGERHLTAAEGDALISRWAAMGEFPVTLKSFRSGE